MTAWQRFPRGPIARQTCDGCQRTTEVPAASGWLWRDLGGDVRQVLCAYCARQQARYSDRRAGRMSRPHPLPEG
jgi:hypothetical protein